MCVCEVNVTVEPMCAGEETDRFAFDASEDSDSVVLKCGKLLCTALYTFASGCIVHLLGGAFTRGRIGVLVLHAPTSCPLESIRYMRLSPCTLGIRSSTTARLERAVV